jgi:hypothetical protein
MSATNGEKSPEEKRRILEREAEIVQSRLLRAVDALDARRQRVVSAGKRAKSLALPFAISVLGVAALVGAGVYLLGKAAVSRKHASFGYRLRTAIKDMDLVARPSLGRRIFEKVALAAVTMAANELGRRAGKNLLDGRFPDGRLMAADALARARQRRPRRGGNGIGE